ncbi:MFS transporter [Paraburkholderia sp. DGU8]|uniref:MFS transporter n=1 Tax=Paraburkholderia sp. DGU8 TaxID=3161997 RepID=UPI003467C728
MNIAVAVPAKRTAVRWKIFCLLLTLVTVNYIDRSSLSVAMPLIAKEFDLRPAMQGLMFSAFFWAYALMQVPGGLLTDRFKPRIVIAAATIIWGICQGLAGLCGSATALLLTRLGLGAAEAPIMPAGGKLNAIWMAPNERGRAATLQDGGSPLGAAFGSLLIAGLIAAFGSWRIAFITAGAGTVVVGLFAWYFIRNSPRDHRGVNAEEADYIEQANAVEHRTSGRASGKTSELFRYRSVWCMILGYTFSNIVFFGLLTWLPSYLAKVHGLDISQLGFASFLIYLCGFAGEIVAGNLGDHWKTAGGRPNTVMRTLLCISAAIVTLAAFSVGYVTDRTLTIVLLCVTMFFLRWSGLYWSVPAIIGMPDKVGLLGGLMNLGSNLGGALVPLVVGVIVQTTGSYFLAMMVFAGAGIGLLICSLGINYEKKIPV